MKELGKYVGEGDEHLAHGMIYMLNVQPLGMHGLKVFVGQDYHIKYEDYFAFKKEWSIEK